MEAAVEPYPKESAFPRFPYYADACRRRGERTGGESLAEEACRPGRGGCSVSGVARAQSKLDACQLAAEGVGVPLEAARQGGSGGDSVVVGFLVALGELVLLQTRRAPLLGLLSRGIVWAAAAAAAAAVPVFREAPHGVVAVAAPKRALGVDRNEPGISCLPSTVRSDCIASPCFEEC